MYQGCNQQDYNILVCTIELQVITKMFYLVQLNYKLLLNYSSWYS